MLGLSIGGALLTAALIPSSPPVLFPITAVDPCETTTVPAQGVNKTMFCNAMTVSCEDAFGTDFECAYLSGSNCNCVVKPAPPG